MFFVVLSLVLVALLILVTFHAGNIDRDRVKAERALRLCQESMMRGAAVERVRTRSTSPASDEWHYRILTHNGALRLTAEQFQVAREREIRETK